MDWHPMALIALEAVQGPAFCIVMFRRKGADPCGNDWWCVLLVLEGSGCSKWTPASTLPLRHSHMASLGRPRRRALE